MKNILKALLLCVAPLSAALAQEPTNPPPSNTTSSLTVSSAPGLTVLPASGLQVSQTRTKAERIQFLMDVADAYAADKDYVSAATAYERILEIDPMNAQARYIIAHTYINAKEYKKAETMLIALIDERPDDFRLLNNLAWLYATADDPAVRDGKKAVRYAQEAMVLAPNDYHVWSTLSEAYYVSGDYEKAYRAIEQMAGLASLYGKDLDQESLDEYNEQIRKCKRALDADKLLRGEDDEGQAETNAIAAPAATEGGAAGE